MKRAIILLLLSLACCVAFGQSAVQRQEYSDFSRGIFAGEDFRLYQPGQFVRLMNLVIAPDRSVVSRRGFARTGQVSAISNSRPVSINYFGSIVRAYVAGGNELFFNTTHVATDSAMNPMIEPFSSSVVVFANVSSGRVWSYTNFSTLVQTATFTATIADIITHNDRIFLAAGSVLYETAVNTADDWANGQAWSIPEGGDIAGLGVADGNLYIFKRSKIFVMSGYTPGERSIHLFSPSVGATLNGDSSESGVVSFTSPSGDAIAWFSRPRALSMIAGGRIYDVGRHLSRHFLSGLYPPTLHFVRSMNLAFFYSGNNQGENVCLHLDMVSPDSMGLFIPATTWKIDRVIRGIDFPTISGPLVDGAYQIAACADPFSGIDGSFDNYVATAPIEIEIRTPFDAFGDETVLKNVRKMQVRGDMRGSAGTASGTIRTFQNVDVPAYGFPIGGTLVKTDTAFSIASPSFIFTGFPSGYATRHSFGFSLTASTTPYVENPYITIRSIILDFVFGSKRY